MDQPRSAIPELDKSFGPYIIFDQADGFVLGKWPFFLAIFSTICIYIYRNVIPGHVSKVVVRCRDDSLRCGEP